MFSGAKYGNSAMRKSESSEYNMQRLLQHINNSHNNNNNITIHIRSFESVSWRLKTLLIHIIIYDTIIEQ